MKTLNFRRAALTLAAAFLGLFAVTSDAQATAINYFQEGATDASNNLLDPTMITGGPYDGVQGNIGDSSGACDEFAACGVFDSDDYFAFHWLTTGDFTATYLSGTLSPELWLYTYVTHALVAGPAYPTLIVPNLAEGDYILRVSADFDPPYTIRILGLDPGPMTAITAAAVPEPGTWLLLGTGVTALAWRRRRTLLRGRATRR